MTTKRLTKSATDRRISGVAGGLAEYFNVDPTLVRLLFVLFTFAGGPGILVYIVLSLVLPEAGYIEKPKRQEEF
jgi:phage shock protein C